jgi:peptidoglycan/xylan/chitin deacetylase (PgdA/CDA1 family)
MMAWMKRRCLAGLLVAFFSVVAAAQSHKVAITIDDLPRGGDGGSKSAVAVREMTAKLLAPFREQKIPLIGFVNSRASSEVVRENLKQWLDAGAELGNHSFSHPDINNIPLDQYTADITQGEPAIREALTPRGMKLEYFRHPYLHAGATPEAKAGLSKFLAEHGYTVAPVTIDNSDYMFAALYTKPEYRERVKAAYIPYMESVVAFFEERAKEVAGHDVAQTLLIHANQLNADLMPDLLAMFRKRGYTFVSLREALKDEAYRLPDEYVGRSGFSWVHRWSMTKKMPNKGEPDPPKWVEEGYAKLPQ